MPRAKTHQQVLSDHSVSDPSGCILWTGTQNKGYGKLLRHGKTWFAHRFAWTIERGPIPDGMVIDHLCRTPLCINTSHMEVTTVLVNTLRGTSGSAENAAKTHCIRGHEFNEANTNHIVRKGRPARLCRTCRRLYPIAARMGMTVDELIAAHPEIESASLALGHSKESGRVYVIGTHCARGHEYTPENTITRVGVRGRICRACKNADNAAYKARRRMERAA